MPTLHLNNCSLVLAALLLKREIAVYSSVSPTQLGI
jgi:hypothetical protein